MTGHRLRRWDHWLAPLLVALLTCIVFAPALRNGFVWDDDAMFLQNPYYRGLGWAQLGWMLTTVHMAHYTPLSWITLGLDYLLWGMAPAGYHATNVVLHAASAALFCRVAARLLGKATAGSSGEAGLAVQGGAVLTALLFAAHPLRVESVAWVTERRDVLSGLFYLAAVLVYLRACEAEAERGAPARGRYAACLALFALALSSKSMAVSLPVVLLILDVYPLRRLGGAVGWSGPAARRVWMEKLPFVLLSAAAGTVQLIALVASGNAATVVRPGALGRVGIAVYGLALYFEKTVLPIGLSPLYELYPQPDFLAWPFLVSGAVVLGLTGLALALRTRWPALLAVWVSSVVILLPVLGTVNTFQIAADRYTYLSGLGWALLGGGALAWWGGARPGAGRNDQRAGFVIAALALVAVGALATLTVSQIQIWRDAEALWAYALRVDARSTVAHYNLGVIRMDEGRLEEAVERFAQAVRGRPDYAAAHNNLGLALIHLGRPAEAVEPLRRAVSLRPASAFAHNNLGFALMQLGRWAEASAQFAEALRIDPNGAMAHANWGEILLAQNRPAEALARFERALALQPSLAGLTEARARAQAALGRAERK